MGAQRKGLIESGIFTRRNKAAKQTRSVAIGLQPTSPGVICPAGYHAMIDAPEVAAAIWRIADMIGSMTIHLMQNTDKGDVRVRNALARKVDIDPFSLTTRQTWVNWIVQQMLLEGNAFVLPSTSGGILTDLVPMPQAIAQLRPDGNPYEIVQNDTAFRPDEVLHFRLRPDVRKPWLGCSPRVQLSAVVDSIMAAQTTKTAMMSSEYKPPIIISVNADANLADEELRTEFLEKFWKRTNTDEPVVLPADVMSVNSVKPLSLTDLAIKDGVELDRRSVGAIFGVPGFLLGVGSFNREEFNVFVSTVLRPLAQVIEQELTKKLLYANDLYFRFNSRSLYAYDLKDLADIGDAQYIRGLMTGNEVRDWIGLSPREGLDKLVMLENYIPADRIGDQAKLTGGDDNADET